MAAKGIDYTAAVARVKELWTREQGSWAHDVAGRSVGVFDETAVSYSKAGAIIRALEEQVGSGACTSRQYTTLETRLADYRPNWLPVPKARALHITVECPRCGYGLTRVATARVEAVPSIGFPKDVGFDNNFNEGEGAYVSTCHSCGEKVAVPRDLVEDLQHACLVLIGEA
jgi:hypothetical protein